MNFRTKNGFKDLQVILKELNLYAGAIDGFWGRNTSLGASTLLRTYATHIGRGPLEAASLPTKVSEDGKNVVLELQKQLAGLGLYKGGWDGIWGNGTQGGLDHAKLVAQSVLKLPAYGACWSALVPKAFVAKIEAWCARKGYDPRAVSWLMACMHFESDGTFSPSIQNKAGAQAFGLIQFMKGAASDLKTTLPELVAMDAMTQLDYVFKYFEFWERAGKRYTQLEDFYLTIFYPAAVGKKADEVIFREGTKGYTQNAGFDKRDRKGFITVGQICSTIYDTYYTGMVPSNRAVA